MQADAGMTRRGFVRAGATAGAALALGSGLAVGEEPSAAVRVGIVGVGSRGTGLLQTLLTLEGVEVVRAIFQECRSAMPGVLPGTPQVPFPRNSRILHILLELSLQLAYILENIGHSNRQSLCNDF